MALKQDFTKQLEGQLTAWQGQIKDYQERLGQAGASSASRPRPTTRRAWPSSRPTPTMPASCWTQAREASEGAWEDMQAASGKAFAQLQQGWADVLKRFQ